MEINDVGFAEHAGKSNVRSVGLVIGVQCSRRIRSHGCAASKRPRVQDIHI